MNKKQKIAKRKQKKRRLKLKAKRAELLKNKKVVAFAGIGNPSNFFNLLKQLGFEISEYAFPDHHVFHSVDFEIMDNLPTVMTEKDAIKCSFLDHTNYWYLKIEAEVSDNFEQDFLAEIKSK